MTALIIGYIIVALVLTPKTYKLVRKFGRSNIDKVWETHGMNAVDQAKNKFGAFLVVLLIYFFIIPVLAVYLYNGGKI